ncbi:MerC domain-containing protein [Roseibacillus ishigakijimensis]|uniref:MerC domain-containing protein n=1 Tax=Roseibacillus ishigakijimensis TaxID=454146 RepID=A0A934RSS8_9BACT|nr:MerC domain-containing protein [Roseibacillus ishigakijimensis]MBK1835257.1 MerC domain-containing protein [Roseibacillus ishigakijimensis]
MSFAPSFPRLSLHHADRMGVAASVLCAIHCALAPIFLIALPTFGRIWAHPASHALVALFIVPLAAFSIYRGYRVHGKRWVAGVALLGILAVLVGSILPAFSSPEAPVSAPTSDPVAASGESCESGCSSCASEAAPVEEAACADACCPSVQVSASGEKSLHIPPAAIVTTLGGFFLITAHVGNLCACGHACRTKACCG